MDPSGDDHVLDVFRAFAGRPLQSVGMLITVLCGGEELSAAFLETAAAAGDDRRGAR